MPSPLSPEQLKQQHYELRPQLQDVQNLRLHRAISWLQAADDCPDKDGQFIFLWVSFNAAYANEIGKCRKSESEIFNNFLQRIIKVDEQAQIYNLLWKNYTGAIRVLLDNRYVFQPYWDWANAPECERKNHDWKNHFEKAKSQSHKALAKKDVASVLKVVFNRLYTLRNQLIHGGATFNSQVNRTQINDACAIIRELMPLILKIMMSSDSGLWGDAIYPVIND